MFDAPVPVVLNAAAGRSPPDRGAERLSELLREQGIEPRVVTVAGDEVEAAVRGELEAGAARIVIAGGDGSVNAAANAIAGTDVVLGILPLGTSNHFVKDLGIPSSVPRSIECLINGVARRIDVATVNGRVFVNNSSIGAYAELIQQREAERARSRRGKQLALLLAAFKIARRQRAFRARIELGSELIECVTPFVFVGNNEYDGSLLRLEWRARLDAGKLWVFTLEEPGTRALIRATTRLFRAGPSRQERLLVRTGEAVTIHLQRKQVRVAYDGESQEMAPPLVYQIHPRALRVLVPKLA